VLFWPLRDYLIIHRADRKPIEIVTVVHGSRDVLALFKRVRRPANSPCQKSGNAGFAGESACATSTDQQFAAPGGACFSLPELLTRAAK